MRSQQSSDWRGAGLALALIALLLGLGGCLGNRCSAGQVLFEGMCRAAAADAGGNAVDAGGAVEAGAQTDAGAGGAADADGGKLISGLGEACDAASPCAGDADYCVVQLGQSAGYCSLRDCQLSPNDCPPGYLCKDLRQFMPQFPLFCSRLSQ
ncbi:MAG: hypothetical protein IPL40_05620 [Proteobacteria bacterium]|nr:hypothetical protein [Pseudomonadota bacterium]